MKKFRTAVTLLGSLALASTLLTGCSDDTTAATSPQTVTYYSQYLYNVNTGATPSTVTSYIQHLDSGSLTVTQNPARNAGNGGAKISINPAGQFAYVNNNGDNNISQYSVSPSYGYLTALANATVALPVASAGAPVGGAVHPSGLRYYSCNNNGDVSVFDISNTGQLVANPTVTAVANGPEQIAFDASGVYAYVTTSSGLYAFTVDATTGALTPAATPTYGAGVVMGGIVRDNANHLYITAGTNEVYGYSIGTTGALTALGTAGVVATLPVGSFLGTPTGLTFEPNHAALYVTEPALATPAIGAFSVSAGTGTLTAIVGANAQTNVCDVAADPTGSYLYCTNFGTNSIGAYVIGTGGSLSLVAGQPFLTGTNPISLKLLQFVSYISW